MRRALGVVVASLVLAACSTTRVVPVPAAGVVLDPAARSAAAQADGIEIVVRPGAWQGNPASLPGYVTPFHLLVVNGSPLPLRYDYPDLKLFDEARFQYTALPPADVARILRAVGETNPAARVALAAAGTSSVPLHWRRPFFWDPWWWGPAYYPYPYYPPPRYDDIFVQALPVGVLDPGARTQGFVYFPRLRPDARRLTLEFHHRLGDAPHVLTLPFAVERAERRHEPSSAVGSATTPQVHVGPRA